MNGEVTLREMILKLGEYARELYRYRILILGFSLLGLILFSAFAISKKAEFSARLTFMINEDNGNPFGSIGTMPGSFGIETRG